MNSTSNADPSLLLLMFREFGKQGGMAWIDALFFCSSRKRNNIAQHFVPCWNSASSISSWSFGSSVLKLLTWPDCAWWWRLAIREDRENRKGKRTINMRACISPSVYTHFHANGRTHTKKDHTKHAAVRHIISLRSIEFFVWHHAHSLLEYTTTPSVPKYKRFWTDVALSSTRNLDGELSRFVVLPPSQNKCNRGNPCPTFDRPSYLKKL
jgi:hypothetical protein